MGGILFFGETKTRKEMRWLLIGIACFVLGAVLLGCLSTNYNLITLSDKQA